LFIFHIFLTIKNEIGQLEQKKKRIFWANGPNPDSSE